MTRVYLISGDHDYMDVFPTNMDQCSHIEAAEEGCASLDMNMVFECYHAFWKPQHDGVVTDIPHFLKNDCLILSARARTALGSFLDRSGVVLPIALRDLHRDDPLTRDVARMDYRLFFCTTVIDALDHDKLERFPREHNAQLMRMYAFHEAAVRGAGLFRVPVLVNRLFATEEFIDAIAAHDITGLRMQPLWSSTDGPLIRLEDWLTVYHRFTAETGPTLAEKRRRMRARIAARDHAPAALRNDPDATRRAPLA